MLKRDGDPETPFLPSKYYAYRTDSEENLRERQVMPSIPVMPIGYRDASKIMQRFDGLKVKVLCCFISFQLEVSQSCFF